MKNLKKLTGVMLVIMLCVSAFALNVGAITGEAGELDQTDFSAWISSSIAGKQTAVTIEVGETFTPAALTLTTPEIDSDTYETSSTTKIKFIGTLGPVYYTIGSGDLAKVTSADSTILGKAKTTEATVTVTAVVDFSYSRNEGNTTASSDSAGTHRVALTGKKITVTLYTFDVTVVEPAKPTTDNSAGLSVKIANAVDSSKVAKINLVNETLDIGDTAGTKFEWTCTPSKGKASTGSFEVTASAEKASIADIFKNGGNLVVTATFPGSERVYTYNFGTVAKRDKAPKVKVWYSTDDTWTLLYDKAKTLDAAAKAALTAQKIEVAFGTTKKNVNTLPEASEESGAVNAPAQGDGWTVLVGADPGIEMMELSSAPTAKTGKLGYIARKAADVTMGTGTDSLVVKTIIPASASKAIKVSTELKAPKVAIDFKKMALKLKAGYEVKVGESDAVTYTKDNAKTTVVAITPSWNAAVRTAATGKKPASATAIIKLAEASEIGAVEAIVASNGTAKPKLNSGWSVLVDTSSNKWGNVPKLEATATFSIRKNATAKKLTFVAKGTEGASINADHYTNDGIMASVTKSITFTKSKDATTDKDIYTAGEPS